MTYTDIKNKLQNMQDEIQTITRELDKRDQEELADELDAVRQSLRRVKIGVVKTKFESMSNG